MAAALLGQPVPTWRSLGHVSFLPDLGLAAWGLWFDERVWRRSRLAGLRATSPAANALGDDSSLLLGIGWAGWHLPAFFYIPVTPRFGLRMLPGFFLGLLAGCHRSDVAVQQQSRQRARRGVVACVVQLRDGVADAGGLVAAIASTLVMVLGRRDRMAL
jgi:hypothetical protein